MIQTTIEHLQRAMEAGVILKRADPDFGRIANRRSMRRCHPISKLRARPRVANEVGVTS